MPRRSSIPRRALGCEPKSARLCLVCERELVAVNRITRLQRAVDEARIDRRSVMIGRTAPGIAHRVATAPTLWMRITARTMNGQRVKRYRITRAHVPAQDVMTVAFGVEVRQRFKA